MPEIGINWSDSFNELTVQWQDVHLSEGPMSPKTNFNFKQCGEQNAPVLPMKKPKICLIGFLLISRKRLSMTAMIKTTFCVWTACFHYNQ